VTSAHPDRADRKSWADLDGWRRLWREAPDVDTRRAVVAAWAAAAGGEVRNGMLRLPPDLPRRLARAEMMANASHVGLTLAEVSAPPCAWCREPAEPDPSLCDHCGWLAGSGRVTPPAEGDLP
jgi:hypothetical protein